MKVLLIGECYSSNVGDQIVAAITNRILSEVYPSASIIFVDISGRKSQLPTQDNKSMACSDILRKTLLKYMPRFEAIWKWRSKINRKKYNRLIINRDIYDFAVFCGGQVINSTFTKQMSEIAIQLLQANIPTVYSSVGLGIVKNKDIQIFKKLLEYPNVKAISCRCDEKRFNSFFGFNNEKVQGSFDPGICASTIYGINRKENAACVGLGVMYSSRIKKERMISFWRDIVSCLDKKSIQWKMFYTGTWNDYVLAKEILKSLSISNPESRINVEIHSPIDLLNELSHFSKIISFRLHSHILSYSMGIPAIAIRWDVKIDDFFAKIGYSDRVFDVDSDISSIIDKLSECEYISNNIIKKSIIQYTEFFARQCEEALLNK